MASLAEGDRCSILNPSQQSSGRLSANTKEKGKAPEGAPISEK